MRHAEPGMETVPPTVEACSLNHWTTREVPKYRFFLGPHCQSILKETSPGCSLEGMMLKLKLQYSGHLM